LKKTKKKSALHITASVLFVVLFVSLSFSVYFVVSAVRATGESVVFTPSTDLRLDFVDYVTEIDKRIAYDFYEEILQTVVIPHYFEAFVNPRQEGEAKLISPGEYIVLDQSDGDWHLLAFHDGELWADVSKIPTRFEMAAPRFDQLIEWRLACESFAAVMGLGALGIDIQPEEFIALMPQNITPHRWEGNRRIWGDPNEEFVGRMTDGGYAVYPAPIARTINEYFGDYVYAHIMEDISFHTITTELSRGRPVLLWFFPRGPAGGNIHHWYTPAGRAIIANFGTHTVTLIGYDLSTGSVIYHDSFGATRIELPWASISESVYTRGNMAISLIKTTADIQWP